MQILLRINVMCYCIYIYSLDEDLCTIDYKTYYNNENDVFPQLSFCLKDPISEEKVQISSRMLLAPTSTYYSIVEVLLYYPSDDGTKCTVTLLPLK